MEDCRLTMTVRGDKIEMEGENVSVEDLARMAGFLQVFVSVEGLKRGLDVDDVKNNMLDIHLAAMEAMEGMAKNGLPEGMMDKWKEERDGC